MILFVRNSSWRCSLSVRKENKQTALRSWIDDGGDSCTQWEGGAGYGGVGPSVFWGGEKRLERRSRLQGLNIRRCDRDDRQKQNQECKHIAGDVERHERHMKESRHVHTFRSKAYRWARNNGGGDKVYFDERPTSKIDNDDDDDVVVVERLLNWLLPWTEDVQFLASPKSEICGWKSGSLHSKLSRERWHFLSIKT